MLKLYAFPNILFFSTSKIYGIQFVSEFNNFGPPESAALAFELGCNFLQKSQQLQCKWIHCDRAYLICTYSVDNWSLYLHVTSGVWVDIRSLYEKFSVISNTSMALFSQWKVRGLMQKRLLQLIFFQCICPRPVQVSGLAMHCAILSSSLFLVKRTTSRCCWRNLARFVKLRNIKGGHVNSCS